MGSFILFTVPLTTPVFESDRFRSLGADIDFEKLRINDVSSSIIIILEPLIFKKLLFNILHIIYEDRTNRSN